MKHLKVNCCTLIIGFQKNETAVEYRMVELSKLIFCIREALETD